MNGFNYVNQNNPINIGDFESQEMINCRIDHGFLEFCDYSVDESLPCPNRVVNLPNGKQIRIRPNTQNKWIDEGVIQWRDRNSQDESEWVQPSCYFEESESNAFLIETVAYNDRRLDEKAVESFRPTAAGTYYYAITLYDTRTFEESAPILKSIDISENDISEENPIGIRFTVQPIPRVSHPYYRIRFYRMPYGGSEYLLTFEHDADYVSRWQKFDPTEDAYLGDLCDTEKDTLIPFGNTDNDGDGNRDFRPLSITLFDDKLWIGGRAKNDRGVDYGMVYYSRTGNWTSFPAINFFTFPDPVVGISKFDQALIIMTDKSLFYLYGEPDQYAVKEIDYKFNGIAQNSGQSLGNMAYFLALKEHSDKDKAYGVFAFNGSSVADISIKINREFPCQLTHFNWALDNRFFISEKTTESGDIRRIIYDSMAQGFCFAEPQRTDFYYRTKEFSSLPNGKNFLKKVYIRAKGPFILYVVANGHKVITKVRLTSDKPFDHFYYVKPIRASTFSIVLQGWDGTEIYDWSMIE